MADSMTEVVHQLVPRYNITAIEIKHSWSTKCHAYDPSIEASYNYVPHLAPGLIFTIIFAASMIAHIFQTISSRKWWYFSFAIGALCELMGWAARLAAHYCPYNSTLFSLQIAILIIAPCFFSAGIYYILGELIRKWGQQYSLISAKLYLYIFITADIISIVLQAIGGGLASSASSANPPKSTATGTHIMLIGICVQLFSMTVFTILFFYTVLKGRGLWLGGSERGTLALIFATSFSTAMILIRNYYRAVELGQGWKGYLISHEAYFCILDAGLMVLCVVCFNIVFPARFFKPYDTVPATSHKEQDTELLDTSYKGGYGGV